MEQQLELYVKLYFYWHSYSLEPKKESLFHYLSLQLLNLLNSLLLNARSTLVFFLKHASYLVPQFSHFLSEIFCVLLCFQFLFSKFYLTRRATLKSHQKWASYTEIRINKTDRSLNLPN